MHAKNWFLFCILSKEPCIYDVYEKTDQKWIPQPPIDTPSKCVQNLATPILQMLHVHILIPTLFTWPTSTQNIFISIALECTFLQKLPILGILHLTYYGLTEFLEPITYQTTIKFNGKFYQRQKFFPTNICSNKVLLQQKLLYHNSC